MLAWPGVAKLCRKQGSVWYAVQVSTGHEQMVRDMIEQAAGDGSPMDECFVPMYRTAEKRAGEWVPCEKVLFPGYLIVVTKRVDAVERMLHSVKTFTKLLGNDKAFIPLNDQEVAWIEAFTSRDNRTVEMSEGYLEDGHVVVTSGPLVRHEYLIDEVKHRRKKARLKIQMFNRTITAEVGLKLVGKKSHQKRSATRE